MKLITQFENKKVIVLGLAKSGEAAARLLAKLGAIVTVNDGKAFEENPSAQSLLEEGIKVICGGHPLELLDEDFELMVKNPGIRYDNPMVARALEKEIPVWTEVELAYLVSEAPIIGITGSNGKTTTTTMIADVLNHGGKSGVLSGNIGFPASEVAQSVTNQDTLVNPTNHSYFNLSGDFTQTVDRHVFQLNTEGIYPIAPDGVPAKTPDANRDVVKHIYNGALLKDIFADEDEQIQLVSGLDHPFALPAGHDNAGFLYDQGSGRFLLFKTEAPCFVVYTANFVDESVIIAGQPMIQHNGIALEAQALPDAIHSDLKDQVILKAGETFTSKTRYEIVVK